MTIDELVKEIMVKKEAFVYKYGDEPNTLLFPKAMICKMAIVLQPWLTETTLTNQNMLVGVKILIVDDPFLTFMKVALL